MIGIFVRFATFANPILKGDHIGYWMIYDLGLYIYTFSSKERGSRSQRGTLSHPQEPPQPGVRILAARRSWL